MNANLGSLEDEWVVMIDRLNQKSVAMPLRDLEVMWETHQIDGQTFVWKQGMPEWKKIDDLADLKRRILDDTSITFNQPGKPGVQTVPQFNPLGDSSEPRKVSNILSGKVGAVDDDDDPDSLEKKFEKIKQNLQGQNEVQNIELFNEDNIEDLLMGFAEEIEGEHGKKGKGRKKPAKTGPVVDLDTLTDEQIKKMERNKRKAKKQAEKKREKWYMAKVNSNLYVKGLPEDITHDEMKEYFSKAGIIRLDLQTGLEKIKIYKDEKDRPKGDALIAYMRPESVELALELLNETEIRPGVKVFLEQAQFEQKGNYVPRKKVKEDKVALIKLKNDQERLTAWDDEERGEGLKIVMITNLFSPEDIESEENFVENLRQDIQEECEAKLGPVTRVTVYENHPSGPVQVKFKDDAAAEGCIKLMNGRYFAGRQLSCFYWDGKTDYKRTATTVEDENRRLEEFGQWLEQDGEAKNGEAK